MTERPTISVIIPVYNGERFLAEAIGSVPAQTLPPDEIIVVDDGSTDGTAQVIADLAAAAAVPIRYIYQENQGPAAARNHGIRLAQGDVIAFQDADDIWTSTKLEKQVEFQRHCTEKDIVMGQTQFIQESLSGEWANGPEPFERPRFHPVLQSCIFSRSIFDSVGLLNENLLLGEDIDWYMRALEGGAHVLMHPELVLLYRRHAGNSTRNRQNAMHHMLLAVKLSLDRQRAGQAKQPIASALRRIADDDDR